MPEILRSFYSLLQRNSSLLFYILFLLLKYLHKTTCCIMLTILNLQKVTTLKISIFRNRPLKYSERICPQTGIIFIKQHSKYYRKANRCSFSILWSKKMLNLLIDVATNPALNNRNIPNNRVKLLVYSGR